MSTTTHPFTPEEIMAFVDGELPADRAHSFSAHSDQCSECQEAAAAFRSNSHALSQWRVDPLDSLSQQGVIEAASLSGVLDTPLQALEWLRPLQLFFSRPLPWVLACLLFALVIGTQPLRQAKHKVSRTVLAQQAEHALSSNNYSEPAGGGTGNSDSFSDGDSEASKARSVDRAEVDDPTGNVIRGAVVQVPLIARTVSLSIVVKNFDTARGFLDAILVRHNGYAAGLNVATPQGAGRTIQASLRIPAPQLVDAVRELKALGGVEIETQNGEEVTQQHADLLARLKNSRETELRLQDVLRTRTGKVKDVLEVEEEIARVRGAIEQMEAEQQTLEHRVNFATVDLKLREEYKAQLSSPAPSVGMQLRNATVNGLRNASESLLGILLFFAECGPTPLLWLLILLFPARLIWKRYKRQLATS
jgi:hypothetical protein